jgi:hypothetical protein
LGLTFFGLTSKLAPQVRINLFSQIHEIIFHGKGGFDYYTIYNMPIWLRKFTHSQIRKYYEEEKEAYDSASTTGNGKTSLVGPDGKVNTPAFNQASKPYKGKSSYK